MMKKLLFVGITIFCAIGTLEAQNIDKHKLEELLLKAKETNSEAIIIYQNNILRTEKYFGIGHKDSLIETMSCTKSVVGLAAACLLEDGLLDSLDTPVFKFYPEWNQGKKKDITIRHLLTMTSGIQNHRNANMEIYPSPDFVQLALCAELTESPGTKFRYNNKSLNLMSGIFEKVTGKRMDLYIKERLFKPLNIEKYNWTQDKAGNPHMMSGCQLMPRDFAKIGLLLMNNGSYNGDQIISKQNISKVIEPSLQYRGYGLLWWLDYEVIKYTIDDEIINNLVEQKVNPQFISKVELMKGEYLSLQEYSAKIVEIFGENSREYILTNISDFGQFRKKELMGSASIYRADGYLGNYIVVDPLNKIVAIRMISYKSYNFDDETGKDGFREFNSMVKELVKKN